MDLPRIRAHGRSTTGTAWLTNPLRAALWWLAAPFFQGLGPELDRRQQEAWDARRHEIAAQLAARQQEADARMAALRQETAASVASQLGGLRKDAMAVAHRLAGLEEEAAAADQAWEASAGALAAAAADARAAGIAAATLGRELRQDLRASTDLLAERIGAAAAEAHAAAATVAAVHQETRASVAALGERVGSTAAQAQETTAYIAAVQQEMRAATRTLGERADATAEQTQQAVAYVASLHHDVRASVQALHERIDRLVRAGPAHADPAHAGPLHAGPMRADPAAAPEEGLDTLVLARTPGGAHCLVRQHDLIGRQVADGQEWEPHVRAVIERTARPDGVAVDAGAYLGLHSLTMARCFGTVHAFEPQLGIYRLLCANLALNGCANVTTHHLALYDHGGAMRLAPPERQEVAVPMLAGQPDYARLANAAALTFEAVGNGRYDEAGDDKAGDDGAGGGTVRAIALDDLGLAGVALIKVDTQGADLRVLRGAAATIRRCRPVVLFEWERDLGLLHGAVLADYLAFFEALEYDVTVLQEISPHQADYLARPR